MVDRFVKTKECCFITGLGRHTLHKMVQDGKFPKPVKISKRYNGWLHSVVQQWILNKANEQKKEVKNEVAGI
jgi:predicted DNA-binding transcriptional regulator AlpA